MTDSADARRMLEDWFPNRVYPRKDIAKFFQVSDSTVCRWFEQFGIVPFKVVGTPMVCREQIISFLLEQSGPELSEIAKNLSKYHQTALKRYSKIHNSPTS